MAYTGNIPIKTKKCICTICDDSHKVTGLEKTVSYGKFKVKH